MAKKIMVQGTMSNAGKSLLAAGLCRIFKQDGYRVAPFKSQNMALNSYITENGLEMGRAQVMQAEAAGIEPDVAMNPILLKPTNDTGSQVIVNGEVMGTMSAVDYYRRKKDFIPDIMKAFEKLDKEYDIIVLEGAGSPAEINLKADDIVNMGMAKMAGAPVLLVGDIDRGGVFAQLIGTMMLLEDDEKDYVKGLVINKFRGDKSILEPGLKMLEERAKVPVTGVVPYVRLDIDDEDSLTERFRKKDTVGAVDIAVIRTPRISNFTDFNALECIESVSVRYVDRVSDMGDPDIIMLPGTKNTIGDLLWLRENGIEARIKQHASRGKAVFGICGGYQMLGEKIVDPLGAEHKGEVAGLGLLPITTVFEEEKTRTRIEGTFKDVSGIFKCLNGQKFAGYEIHMGVSSILDGAHPMNELKEITAGGSADTKADGVSSGNVYGTYVHGIFDSDNVASAIVSAILESKGLDSTHVKSFNMKEYKERQYDILADAVRENLDMESIYRILDEGI
ncbi:adenosylcobyric acid synthase (glutamine-hydrolysing) [Lachnospiraceae bacterium]|nr:adenosylcobyric acid synthase (glutamine-hydrolysing) [Lachnospiraceae bacterium]